MKYFGEIIKGKSKYNEYKMSPTSISGGGNLLTGGELISPASLKGQEEVLPSAKLEQCPYNACRSEGAGKENLILHMDW